MATGSLKRSAVAVQFVVTFNALCAVFEPTAAFGLTLVTLAWIAKL